MIAILDGLGVTFCHDRLGHAFMTVPQEGAGHLTFNLAGRGAAEILARAFYRGTGQGLRQAARDDILALLKARALHDGPQEAVFARVARQADRVIIDLGRPDGSAVQITKEGFEVVAVSPVKFARPSGTLPLPEPRQVGSVQEVLAKFRRLLGQPKDTFVLALAFILNCLRGSGPYLCLLIEGEQGSGKSLFSAILRRIIDPNVAEKMRLPDNERDLMILADQFFLLLFDNASGMRADLSDALCCLSTGGGFATRKLYTDADVHVIQSMRPFIINGISDFVTRPDLLERAIPIHLEAVKEGQRKTEAEMLAGFEALLRNHLVLLSHKAASCGRGSEA